MTKAQFLTYVDSLIVDNIVGAISAADLRAIIKSLGGQLYDDYAAAADNTGQGPRQLWLKPATGTTGLTNSDDLYHNGSVGLGASTLPAEKLQVTGNILLTGMMRMPATLANRRLVLYDATNDHQFYGFGINSNVLRYQVASTSDSHVWFVGINSTTSTELMRLSGAGKLGIGVSNPANQLDVARTGATGATAAFKGSTRLSYIALLDSEDTFIRGGKAGSHVFLNDDDTTAFVAIGGAYPPTSKLHVKAANGHNQLRLETSYTPTSSADTNGAVGQIGWDTNYFYVKTVSGWKRSALSTW